MHTNLILEPTCSKTEPNNGRDPLTKMVHFCTVLARLLPGTSGRHLDPQNHEKMCNEINVPIIFVSIFCCVLLLLLLRLLCRHAYAMHAYLPSLLHLLQHTFCTCGLASRVHGKSHCNYSRRELYLLSLGKVKMLTQCPQIAWGVVWRCCDDPPQASSIIM